MKKRKDKKNDNGMKFLYLFIVVIAFTLAFALLINKQSEDRFLADMNDNSFNVQPQLGKVIVAKDTYAIYPKYYVVLVNKNHYSIYVYNYYETLSQYNLEYNRLINQIVDYNIKDKMIRYLYIKGYGTYEYLLNNLDTLVDNSNLLIY